MNVLVIGGNRFMGVGLTWRLLAAGHRVTHFNRGSLADPFGDRIERLRGDRTTPALRNTLGTRSFDGGGNAYGHRPCLGLGQALPSTPAGSGEPPCR